MAMALSEEFEFLQKRITMLQYQVLQCHQGLAKVSGEMEEVAARLQAAAALASKAIPVSETVSTCGKIERKTEQPRKDKDTLASRVLHTKNENSDDFCHTSDFSSFQHWREVIEEIPVPIENKTRADANDVSASNIKDQLMEQTENIIVSKPILRKIGSRTSKDSLKSQKCRKNNHDIHTSNVLELELRSFKMASKIGQGKLNEKQKHESDNTSSCRNSVDEMKETFVKSFEQVTPPVMETNSPQSEATSSTSADRVWLEGMKREAEKVGRQLKETCARRGWRITGDYKSAFSLSGTGQDRDRLYIYQVTVTDGENVNLYSQGSAYSKPIAARLALTEMESKICSWSETT